MSREESQRRETGGAVAPWQGGRCYGARVQGTVAVFDPQTRSGSLLLDDGRRIEFGAAAFDASGLRLLRLGQRVQVTVAGTGRTPDEVIQITLPTMRD